MWFPYAIRKQKDDLAKRGAQLQARRETVETISTPGLMEKARLVYDAYKYFHDNTISRFDRMRSFIPGTRLFRYRIICAKRINDLNQALGQAERIIAKAEPLKSSMGFRRVRSDSITSLPRVYGSPVKWRARKNSPLALSKQQIRINNRPS